MNSRGYELAGDWSRHGIFTGTLEDVTDLVSDSADVVTSWGRGSGRTADNAPAGKLSAAVANHDRQFSPENAASPIAGKVLPGTRLRFQVTVSGQITTLFDGPIDNLEIDPTAPARDLVVEALDGWGSPGAEELSTAVYSGQRTGDLIGVVLDAIGWTGGRSIDAGATVVDWWWAEGIDAATAVDDLIASEGPPAIAFVQGGTFYFRDRHHRLLSAASLASQGLYTHIIPQGSGPAGDFKITEGTFRYDHGLNRIFNAASFEITPRVPADFTHVWTSETPISLGANEAVQLIAQSSDPFILAQDPAPFAFNADGEPTDGEYSLTAGSLASITLSRTSGQTTTITITAGAGGAYLDQGMRLRAVPLTSRASVKVAEEDVSSMGTFRRQAWNGKVPWANAYDASAIAQKVVSVYATPQPVVSLEVTATEGSWPTGYLAQMVARTISDRITIRNDDHGVNADYMVERVTHTVKKMGTIHRLQLECQVAEPEQAANAFAFNVAGRGFNDGAFAANGLTDGASMFQFDTAGHGFDDGRFAA